MALHPWRFPVFGYHGYSAHCQARLSTNQYCNRFTLQRNIVSRTTFPMAVTSPPFFVSAAMAPFKYPDPQQSTYSPSTSQFIHGPKNESNTSELIKERLISRRQRHKRTPSQSGDFDSDTGLTCSEGKLSISNSEPNTTPHQPSLQSENTAYYNEKQLQGQKRIYHCNDCQYTTDRKNNLKRHISTMHEHCSKLLECCDIVFNNKASLRQHVSACHRHGYDCAVCGRTFCRKALLKRHVTVHSGQKDYVCVLCGYATSHKSNLDRHKRRHIPKQLRPSVISSTEEGLTAQSPKSHPVLKTNFFGRFDKSSNFNSPWLFYQQRRIRAASMHALREKKLLKRRLLQAYQNIMRPNRQDPERERTSVLNVMSKPDVSEKRAGFRLAPTLHRCQDCGIVFVNQVLLGEHLASQHAKQDYAEPVRPLTLAWRNQTDSGSIPLSSGIPISPR